MIHAVLIASYTKDGDPQMFGFVDINTTERVIQALLITELVFACMILFFTVVKRIVYLTFKELVSTHNMIVLSEEAKSKMNRRK